jgi:hypothetical protein
LAVENYSSLRGRFELIITGVDSINRLQRPGGLEDQSAAGSHIGVHSEASFAARKFYAQRNLYLTGFTLFLSLYVYRCHNILHPSALHSKGISCGPNVF